MRLERHRFPSKHRDRLCVRAVGGSFQAAAQSITTSRAAIGAGTLSPLHEWLAVRDRGLPEAAASAQSLVRGGADASSLFNRQHKRR
jgi:hypothetical protein